MTENIISSREQMLLDCLQALHTAVAIALMKWDALLPAGTAAAIAQLDKDRPEINLALMDAATALLRVQRSRRQAQCLIPATEIEKTLDAIALAEYEQIQREKKNEE